MSTTLPVKLEPVVQLVQQFIPEADEKTAKAVSAMQKITSIESDDDVEAVNGLLTKVKASYDKFSTLRKEITGPLDEIKEFLMQFEKRVAYDGKTANEYTRLRGLIQAYKQEQLEKKKAEEALAAKKREKEDYKVQLEAQIKKNLAQMVIDRVVELDEKSRKWFEQATVENFDEQAKKYSSFKPLLKEEHYDACFNVAYDRDKLPEEEFTDWVKGHVKFIEDYEKWKNLVIEGTTAILNEWRAKIPDLKAEKVSVAQAKSEEEKIRLQAEVAKREQDEADRKKSEFAQLKADAVKQIDEETDINKMNNAFQQQAITQELGDTGPVKRFLRFTDDKQVGKPLFNVMYHCFLSPKFPGIYKLDKNKQRVKNEQGEFEYIAPVQWWLDFFITYCEAEVPGTHIKEVAKVIVRK